MAVLGSAAMMSDTYIDKEDNSRVKDVILSFLTSDEVSLNKIDAEDPEVSDYTMIPYSSSRKLMLVPNLFSPPSPSSTNIEPPFSRYFFM